MDVVLQSLVPMIAKYVSHVVGVRENGSEVREGPARFFSAYPPVLDRATRVLVAASAAPAHGVSGRQ